MDAKQLIAVLERVRCVLDTDRIPVLIEDTQYSYVELFKIIEQITSRTYSSLLTFFNDLIGNYWDEIHNWSNSRTVNLRFTSTEKQKLKHSKTRIIETPTQREISKGLRSFVTGKIITEIEEYYWDFSVEYQLSVFQGTEIDKQIILSSGSTGYEFITQTKIPSRPPINILEPIDIIIDDFLQHFDDNRKLKEICINRTVPTYTPRRNPMIDSKLSFMLKLNNWTCIVSEYIAGILRLQNSGEFDFSVLNIANNAAVILPIVVYPVGETSTKTEFITQDEETRLFADCSEYFNDTLMNAYKQYDIISKKKKTIITKELLRLQLIVSNMKEISDEFSIRVSTIEEAQRKKLIEALGREISPIDVSDIMKRENRLLFKEKFQPRAFCFDIKKSDEDDAEGQISILSGERDPDECIQTFTKVYEGAIVNTKISASISVSMNCSKFVHGWVQHEFSPGVSTPSSFYFNARAKQYSSFIVLIGSVLRNDEIDIKRAIILLNGREINVPLEVKSLPTAKAFKAAISSLSPEQQAFSEAFRSMQLAGSLFVITTIPIVPQIERVLNLPERSLTKEIELCEQIIELFVSYQIPSDLLAFQGCLDIDCSIKLAEVKRSVGSVLQMIQEEKDFLLAEKLRQEELKRLEEMKRLEEEKKQREKEEQKRREREESRRKLEEVRTQMKETSMILNQNIERLLERGDCMEHLMCQSESLSAQSQVFMKKSKRVSSSWFSNPFSGSTSTQNSPVMHAPAMDCVDMGVSLPECLPLAESSNEIIFDSVELSIKPAESEPEPTELEDEEVDDVDPNEDSGTEDKEEILGDLNESEEVDITQIPKKLDNAFENLDPDDAIHSTTIKAAKTWCVESCCKLGTPLKETLGNSQLEEEQKVAVDLLDSISRSGGLSLIDVDVHVLVGVSHWFDLSLTDTLIQNNMNPISKLERTGIIVASILHDLPSSDLLSGSHTPNTKLHHPQLFHS